MPYVICNDNSYLCQAKGGFFAVDNINQATKWKKISSANNILNDLPEDFDNYGFSVRYVTKNGEIAVEPMATPTELDYDILEKADEIAELARQAENRRTYLLEKIQMIDLEIVDIEHAAEFYNLNAAQGYKLYKMLHNARVERRELKNELEKINMFLGSSIGSAKMENLKKSITGMENRQYSPRVNKELFGV